MDIRISRFDIDRNHGGVAQVIVLSDPDPVTKQPYHYTMTVGARLRPLEAPAVSAYTPSVPLPIPGVPDVVVVFDFYLEEPGTFDSWPPEQVVRAEVAKVLLGQYGKQFASYRPA